MPTGAKVPGVGLLTLFDGLVAKDPAPPGFSGTLCFGVMDGTDDARWWLAKFGEKCSARILPGFPKDLAVDTLVLIGEEEAQSILASGKLPNDAEVVLVEGDRKLLVRFADRYLVKIDPLAFQMQRITSRRPGRGRSFGRKGS